MASPLEPRYQFAVGDRVRERLPTVFAVPVPHTRLPRTGTVVDAHNVTCVVHWDGAPAPDPARPDGESFVPAVGLEPADAPAPPLASVLPLRRPAPPSPEDPMTALHPIVRVAAATSPPSAPVLSTATVAELAPALAARGPAFVAELVHALVVEAASATHATDPEFDIDGAVAADHVASFLRRCERRQRRARQRAARRGSP